jgi:hypothetical protein
MRLIAQRGLSEDDQVFVTKEDAAGSTALGQAAGEESGAV